MNKEEKKAISMLAIFISNHKFYNIKHTDGLEDNIEILLNLIEKTGFHLKILSLL